MELGKNIYAFRKEQGLSQEKLAERVGVTRQTISNWELGETAPNPEQLILLSKVFQKSIDELVGNEIKPEGKSPEHDGAENFRNIYIGFAVLCGVTAGVWAFCANRFRNVEILGIMLAGMAAGLCLGLVCHEILKCIKSNNGK